MLGLGGTFIKSLKMKPRPLIKKSSYSNTKSLDLDGTDDYANMGNIDLIGTTDYSVSLWFKGMSGMPPPTSVLISKGAGPPSAPLWKLFVTSNRVKWEQNDGTTRTVISNSGTSYLDNAWHHAVVTGDRSDVMSIYVDGTKQSQTTNIEEETGDLDDTGKSLFIGSYSKNNGNDFNGNIDEVAIWRGTVLSAADVTAIYNSGRPLDLTQSSSYDSDKSNYLVGYWRFEDNYEDSSDSENDGAGVNDATFEAEVPT